MTSTKRVTIGLDKVIGLRVRAARIEIEMSQSQLGVALGVSFQQIQKYEKGKNRVSASSLVHIAETLRKPISYFLEEARYKPNSKGEQMAQFIASHEGAQLINAAMELPPKVLRHFTGLAREVFAQIPA